ncbi:MAG: precorrin-2 C(20)-methyltransferase [Synergistaceae bacterium]|nr:precorrin-2 C(20)-methyltransferase [Synergistaceae bacterium]
MRNFTQLFIAGLGPGDFELVTFEAVKKAEASDLILVPRSKIGEQGLAEKIISHHLPERSKIPILFPMIRDSKQRQKIIVSQLEAIKPELESAKTIFFPVIGDSMLYSTGAYLVEALREIIPDVEAGFIPGISAHSLAASAARRFLAMSDEIFTIIPGTAPPEKIASALEHSDSAAIYKPKAAKSLREIITRFNFSNIIRVDFAGIPERERVIEGVKALDDVDEYLSIILLWR